MKLDLYVKTLLTIITLSLVKIAFLDTQFTKMANAESNKVQKISICAPNGYQCVKVTSDGKILVK